MTTALRPLSTGELLDRTFSLYRGHFGLFLGLFALPHLFVLAYQCIGLTFKSPNPQLPNLVLNMFWAIGAALLSLAASAASQAATVIAVSQVHLDRPAGVADSFSRVKSQILPVIGLSLLVGLAAGAACLALIVPGVLLFIMWSLAVPAKILENRGVLDSMSRSMDLTKGNRGRIFVIWLLFIVLGIGVSLLLRWPVELAAGVTSIFAMQRTAPVWQAALLGVSFISECLVGPLATIAFSLVYYDERVRKEAFDLQLMMTTLDVPAAPGSPAQVGA
ncbi:MAG: hypothetical protein ABSG34_12595 [Candidatus Sulfotelmatobacter sp.]|jgi:hypothetical protein